MPKNSEELAKDLTSMMRVMANEDQWPIPLPLVERMVEQVVGNWLDDVQSEIQTLIKEWETKMEDDNTLYSLGLRRALDVVKGESSVA